MTDSLEARVAAYVSERVPDIAAGRLVLAASGGADSTAMVVLLCETGIAVPRRAVVAHFDHALRGDESAAADRDAVDALCRRYGLDLRAARWDAPRRSEAAARDARYRFLADMARETGAAAIVTGHTADDQAETVLMHAMRGAGLHGLAGMAPISPCHADPAIAVARPLLAVTRAETRAYCAARGLRFHDDASNDDPRYLRNRVRRELLPALEAHSPSVRAALLTLAGAARAQIDALDALTDPLVRTDAPSGGVSLDRAALAHLSLDARAHAFRRAIAAVLGDAREYDRRHYAMLERAARARTGATLQLPRGVIATVDADAVVVSLGAPRSHPVRAGLAVPLPWSGIAGAWELRAVPAASDATATLALPGAAVVRRRRAGDRIATRAGMHRKLKEEYIDRKIPARERDAAPVIAVGADVLWSPLLKLPRERAGVPYRIEARRVTA